MPDWKSQIHSLMAGAKLDPGREAGVTEELNQHLNDKYEELIAAGATKEEAYATLSTELNSGNLSTELRSLLQSKNQPVPLGKEEGGNLLAELWNDLLYGMRLLRLNPAFAIVAILSLSLGIGANTAIFQLINAVRLRSLPVKNPQELVQVKIVKAPNGRTGSFSGPTPTLTYAIWENIRDRQKAFSNIAAWNSTRLNLNRGGEAKYVRAIFVSGSFFDTLGIQPAMGRLTSPTDDQKGCGSSGVVLSDSFWQRQYGGSGSALGSKITLEGQPFEVIGVTLGSFFGVEVGQSFDVALPLCAEQLIHIEEPLITNPQGWWLGAIGRLRSGWTSEQASSQLATISRGIFETTLPPAYDATDSKNYLSFVLGTLPANSGVSELRKDYENPLWLMMAISGLVLLIACANLANLMVARASARQREMAMRLALGASRNRLIRQMLAESLLLAVIGALIGALVAKGLSGMLVSLLNTQKRQYFLDLHPDWRVLGFTAGLAIFTCLLFGLMPAIQSSRTEPGELMKGQGRGNTSGPDRLGIRRALVISQVALSLRSSRGFAPVCSNFP